MTALARDEQVIAVVEDEPGICLIADRGVAAGALIGGDGSVRFNRRRLSLRQHYEQREQYEDTRDGDHCRL